MCGAHNGLAIIGLHFDHPRIDHSSSAAGTVYAPMISGPPLSPGGMAGGIDDAAMRFGLMNALRTGNVVLDMAICMLMPLVFGGIAGATAQLLPKLRQATNWVWTRNQMTRRIEYERKYNQYGWTVGRDSDDNLLQKGLMLYLSKVAPCAKRQAQKTGIITLTERSKHEQQKLQLELEKTANSYDSDDEYGPAATLRNMEVSHMPSDGIWLDAGDGIELLRTHSTSNDDNDNKSSIKTETTTITMRAHGKDADARISALVQKAFDWYAKSLEAEKDEKRYLYMMLRNPSGGGEGGDGQVNRLYKRYELSDEKTFSSLYFPQKSGLLYLLDHFSAKTGKFAVPGFPHKLGLLLHGPPGTGKTSLIKAIAHYTKRNIVSVPLSRIRTNQELMDVMFDHSYSVVNTSKTSSDDESTINVPLDFRHTIFVMEDVDAASSVVQHRAPKHDSPPEKIVKTTTVSRTGSKTRNSAESSPLKKTAPKWEGGDQGTEEVAVTTEETTQCIEVSGEGNAEVEMGAVELMLSDKKSAFKKDSVLLHQDDKLDLAGLLNVLDGVVDSPNRIVIMTTNHPEKLDPALIRPGRINKQILMGYLQPADAWLMVLHYFGEADERQKRAFFANFQPDVFTPAQVEQLCAEHDTIDEFLIGLGNLRPNEY